MELDRRKIALIDVVKIIGFVFALGIAWSSFSSQLDAHMRDMDTTLKIMRHICQNTATTELSSQRCWE